MIYVIYSVLHCTFVTSFWVVYLFYSILFHLLYSIHYLHYDVTDLHFLPTILFPFTLIPIYDWLYLLYTLCLLHYSTNFIVVVPLHSILYCYTLCCCYLLLILFTTVAIYTLHSIPFCSNFVPIICATTIC